MHTQRIGILGCWHLEAYVLAWVATADENPGSWNILYCQVSTCSHHMQGKNECDKNRKDQLFIGCHAECSLALHMPAVNMLLALTVTYVCLTFNQALLSFTSKLHRMRESEGYLHRNHEFIKCFVNLTFRYWLLWKNPRWSSPSIQAASVSI